MVSGNLAENCIWYGQKSRALLSNHPGKTHTEVVPAHSKTVFPEMKEVILFLGCDTVLPGNTAQKTPFSSQLQISQ